MAVVGARTPVAPLLPARAARSADGRQQHLHVPQRGGEGVDGGPDGRDRPPLPGVRRGEGVDEIRPVGRPAGNRLARDDEAPGNTPVAVRRDRVKSFHRPRRAERKAASMTATAARPAAHSHGIPDVIASGPGGPGPGRNPVKREEKDRGRFRTRPLGPALGATSALAQRTVITGGFDVGPGGFQGNFNPLAARAGFTSLTTCFEPLVVHDAKLEKLAPGR
jgi:hypothetical protein